MTREIVMFGSKVLRQIAKPVDSVDQEIKSLIRDLFDSMSTAEGIGLAAPQLGIPKRVIVVDVSKQDGGDPPIALVNPRIVGKEGTVVSEEGCLSLPDLYGDVGRAATIEVDAIDAEGGSFNFSTKGYYARVLQHEIDHLDGKLFIDHISPLKRQLMRGALNRLKKEGEQWDRDNT